MFRTIRDSNVTLVVLSALFLAMLWFMFGCAHMPRLGAQLPPQTWTGASRVAPALAQQVAYDTLVDMQGQQVTTDGSQGHVSGVLSGMILLHITITREGTGSRVVVTGSGLPDKFGLGTFDEVDRYVAAFMQKLGTQVSAH